MFKDPVNPIEQAAEGWRGRRFPRFGPVADRAQDQRTLSKTRSLITNN
jgi:hypothetical protein